MRLLILVLAGLGLALVGFRNSLTTLWRFAMQVLAALALAGVSALLLGAVLGDGGVDIAAIAIAGALLLFLPWLWLVRRVSRFRTGRGGSPWNGAAAVDGARATGIEAPVDDARAVRAWRALIGQARWARNRITAAQANCDHFLRLADQLPLEPEAIDTARLIRLHIPEMIETCLGHCRLATAAEQRELIADLIASIEAVAAEADRHRPGLMRKLRRDFDVQRADISQRTGRDPLSSL